MRVLLACEESQTVLKAFLALGADAYSCDIKPCSGGIPQRHIQNDVRQILDQGWDLMIAFPPCTHLATSGARWFKDKQDGRQQEGIDFFMQLAAAPIPKIAIENPVGIMSTVWRSPDQVIQPYYFGDPYQKTTCLWLQNLPPLFHTAVPDLFNPEPTHTHRGEIREWIGSDGVKRTQPVWYSKARTGKHRENRSKFWPGIASAMAHQWGPPRL